jgi:endonuclease/exonuclease/phosphatase family metal-dependent hydrolase
VLRAANPALVSLFVLMNGFSLLRTGALLIVEAVLAVVDFVRGLIAGHDLIKEFKFIPTRVMISIGLRELVTIGAKIDVARGLPIVHVNFLGYDEQAHRRGPDSRFAHWTLKGIDDAIRRLHRAARRSARRDYDIWIYSDHGQVKPITYAKRFGASIESAVARVLSHPGDYVHPGDRGEQSQRARLLGGNRVQKILPSYAENVADVPLQVAALGTIALVYYPEPAGDDERRRLASALVAGASIPMVLIVTEDGCVHAFTTEGEFRLPRDRRKLLGEDHPFIDAASDDLIALARHEESGDFILCGWRHGTDSLTFAVENGSHTGANPAEVNAFAVLPPDALTAALRKNFLRPLDLREAVIHHQSRHVKLPWIARNLQSRRNTLRIMTYNVHTCIGMDGKLSPSRIARVIAQHSPDIVALQELDEGRVRTGGVDQAHRIARLMEMDHHFHPAIHIEEERYGDAILTHLPMRLVKAASLPRPPAPRGVEPRGALWVSIDLPDGQTIQVINTHLGLGRRERLKQIDALLGDNWLNHPDCRDPVIFCGDLNALPGSPVCRRLSKRLEDAQTLLKAHRPKTTFFARWPAFRIDHVFVGGDVEVVDIQVTRGAMTQVASDHLPLLIELRIGPSC